MGVKDGLVCVICNNPKKKQSKYCISCSHLLHHLLYIKDLPGRVSEARKIIQEQKININQRV